MIPDLGVHVENRVNQVSKDKRVTLDLLDHLYGHTMH